MEFQVKLTGNAKLEIEAAYLWLKEYNPDYADQWFRDLMNTIATLQDKPKRCAIARKMMIFLKKLDSFCMEKEEINIA